MKKAILLASLALAILLAGCGSQTVATTKVGHTVTAAHGTRSFTVATASVEGDKITSAVIDEFQFVDAGSEWVTVPNSDTDFGAGYAEGKVLISKRVNDAPYSENMKNNGGSTQSLVTSWVAIENFAKGKTIAELEAADAVSGSTLEDTKGYLKAIADAAKAAK